MIEQRVIYLNGNGDYHNFIRSNLRDMIESGWILKIVLHLDLKYETAVFLMERQK